MKASMLARITEDNVGLFYARLFIVVTIIVTITYTYFVCKYLQEKFYPEAAPDIHLEENTSDSNLGTVETIFSVVMGIAVAFITKAIL